MSKFHHHRGIGCDVYMEKTSLGWYVIVIYDSGSTSRYGYYSNYSDAESQANTF